MSAINCEVPEILTKDFFKKSLENGLHENEIQIDEFKVSAGSAVGDNYTSNIYRVEIKYHNQSNKTPRNIFLIVKNIVMEEVKVDLDEVQAFEKEVAMYTSILPKIEKLYNCIGGIVPKCFYSVEQLPNKTIVLEDLKVLGYAIADRVNKLDEAHARLVLQKLGKYHAGTIVLQRQEPEIFEFFKKGFFQPQSYDKSIFQTIFVKSLEQVIETVSNWNDFEKITGKLKNTLKNFRQKYSDCMNLNSDSEIEVLNHSDLWTNNMMFKYENGNPCDVKFIDLQVSTIGSLGCDVNYFLNTSVKFEVLKSKRNELEKIYYESLKRSLEELNFTKIPSLNAILNEIRGREFFGFIVAIGCAPIMNLDRSDSTDSTYDTIIDNDSLSKKRAIVYGSPKFQEFLKYSFKRFDELGVFD